MDGDGDVDVLGAAYDEGGIAWWENTSPRVDEWAFREHTVAADFDGARSVYAADVDRDGDVDVLGAAVWDDDITWWENDGGQRFAEHTIGGGFDAAVAVYAADVDRDGDVDVLGAARDADDITWWENRRGGSPPWVEHTVKGDFNGAHSVYATDVDGDGDVDVLGAAKFADDITWWENDGNQSFSEHIIQGDFDAAISVYAIDLDRDGDVDVLGAANYAHDVTWWENDGSPGDGGWTPHTIDGNFDGAHCVYATDVDGDGDVDVLGAAYSAGDIAWWENDGSQNFARHTIAGSFDAAAQVYAVDVDRDGDVDVLGAAAEADDVTWWENDGSPGDGGWIEHTIGGDLDGTRSVYAADMDGDGDVDVLGAGREADEITWWENSTYSGTYLPLVVRN
jgi:hypothetical protein